MTNVEFHVCPAEDLPLSVGSCDLVTCATAWHWLDAEKFYKEATRVLRQPGVLHLRIPGVNTKWHLWWSTSSVKMLDWIGH